MIADTDGVTSTHGTTGIEVVLFPWTIHNGGAQEPSSIASILVKATGTVYGDRIASILYILRISRFLVAGRSPIEPPTKRSIDIYSCISYDLNSIIDCTFNVVAGCRGC